VPRSRVSTSWPSGRRKKDYAAETAAQALETQAEVMGIDPSYGDDLVTVASETPEVETDIGVDPVAASTKPSPLQSPYVPLDVVAPCPNSRHGSAEVSSPCAGVSRSLGPST